MAELRLEGLTKRFGTVTAVDGIDLVVADGELLVLLGASGAGKTTTLRLMAGLERPDAGRVLIGGRDLTAGGPAERDVAFVFQQYSLYPHYTVYDNLAFPLRSPLRRMPEDRIRARVGAIAEMLRISAKLENKATRLSGGEMQRVAIGRALVREPACFLMDEPLSSLDAKLREDLRIELKRIQRELGATILYVTHDQVEAMTLGDRLLVMDSGQIEQLGTPLEVYARPATTFVAGFIGSPPMNLLQGRVGPDGASVDVGGSRLALASPVAAGSEVLVGIRPEAFAVGVPGDLQGLVDWVEVTGADALVSVRLNGGGDVTVRVDGRLPPPAGARMELSVSSADLHLFDPGTGRRFSATV